MKRRKRQAKPNSQFQQALALVRNTRGGLYKGIAKLRLESDPDLLRRASADFAKHRVYRQFTARTPYPKAPADLPGSGFRYLASFERELAWLSGTLASHADCISEFVQNREQFERCYLLGEYAEATALLDEVERRFGFSIWLTQRRMDLSAQVSGASARNRVLTETFAHGGPTTIHYLMAWFAYRSAAAVSRTEYERFLKEATASLRGIHLLVYADAGVYPDIDAEQAAKMLSSSDVMSIVDRYQYAIVTCELLISGSHADPRDVAAIQNLFCSLGRVIADPLIYRLAFATGATGATAPLGNDLALLALLDQYSSGEYAEIAAAYNVENYPNCEIESLALALRASICVHAQAPSIESWGIDPKSVIGRLAGDLHEVLRFGSGGIDARLRLSKLALVHASQGWASSLTLILERQRHDERTAPPTRDQQMAALRSPSSHPILGFCLGNPALGQRYLAATAAANPESATARSLLSLLDADDDVVVASLPPDRSGHLNGLRLLRHGLHQEAAEVLKELSSDTSSALLRHEASLLLVACHLFADDVASAAALAADLFVEERYFGAVLPIVQLVDKLMRGHDLPLKTSPTRGNISVAIIFDIYSRVVSSNRDAERADAFNDVLRKHNVERASQLPGVISGELRSQLTYFLRYICIPEVLDQSLILDNTRSVEDERLSILLALTEMPDAQTSALDAYKEEIREIRTRQIVRDTALKLDQSKIYVNVDGVRRVLDVEMRENWNRYKFMVANGDNLEFSDTDNLFISGTEDNGNVVLIRVKRSRSERYSLFKRIISEVRDQFTTNKEFGLNSNLSANIRHGYVLRELRAPLVNRNLVTNLISDDRGYHTNAFWAERLEDAGLDEPATIEAFQREMSAFSEGVDRAIEHLNRNLLRIRSDASPRGLFNYALSESALGVLDTQWGNLDTYDEFMDAIFDAMWTATEHNLKSVRAELAGPVLQDFIQAIDDLGARLEMLGIADDLPGISDAITMAKTDMRAAVDRVASWFTLSGHHEYADFDVEIPLRAGLATVKAYDADLEITHSYRATPSPITLQGWSLPGFGRLLFQLLDNAAKHGGRGRNELAIDVSAELEGGSLLLRVENDLPADTDLKALEARIGDLNAEYGQAKAMDLIGEEGGSGYSKVWKLISADLKRDHDISVVLEGNKFVVSILMNAGGIVCRPS